MDKRYLGKSGLHVSLIGLGGIPIQGVSKDEADKVVHAALDLGINLIDSARGYTDSEEKIGRAIKGRRDGLVLATKSMARGYRAMEKDIETSLKNFGTDHVDLYQLHNVFSEPMLNQVMAEDGAFAALRKAQGEGKVGHIGITSHSQPIMCKAIETGMFETAQLPFNFIETQWLEDAIPAARKANAGLIAMKPVAGGALTNVPAALRYALMHGTDVAIPGMDSVAQVEQNARVGAEFRENTAEEVAALEKEKEHWQGHFCRRCGYCKPCPKGLEIPFLLVIEAYYTRYGLNDWALERLSGLDQKYADCDACGECTARCPYELPIPELMKKASKTVV